MKRLAAVALVIAFAACDRRTAPPGPQPLPVTVAKPERREVVVYREFPATLVGAREVEIRARVRGILSLAPGAPDFAGKRVAEGEDLFLIEPEPYIQATQAAEAALTRAEASRDLAEKRYQRVAKAGSTRAVAELDVEIAAAEVAQATAAVSEATAQLEEARITESYTLIKAPVTGRMSRLLVDPGNLVGVADSTLLATIIEDSEMLAYFEVPERPLIRFLEWRSSEDNDESALEAELRLKLADGSIYDHPGRIDYLDNQVDQSTRTAKVRAVFANPAGRLASGLYGLVGYPVGPDPRNPEVSEAILVPSVAILRDIGGTFVWVVDEKRIVRRRGVEIGDVVEKPPTDPKAQRILESVVLRGLDGSENVIVAGLQRAREGAPVIPQTSPDP